MNSNELIELPKGALKVGNFIKNTLYGTDKEIETPDSFYFELNKDFLLISPNKILNPIIVIDI